MTTLEMFDGFTWRAFADFSAALFLVGGVFFLVVGAVGVVRFPDGYHRLHSISVCATLGLGGMLLAACYHLGSISVVSKAVITLVFLCVASPIGGHLLAKAAHDAGAPLWPRTLGDELEEDKAARRHGWGSSADVCSKPAPGAPTPRRAPSSPEGRSPIASSTR